MFTFVPDEQFGQLITIVSHLPTMLKTTNAEFKSIDSKSYRPHDIE